MDKLNFIVENPWVAVIVVPGILFIISKIWDIIREKKNLNLTIDQANQEFRTTIKRMVGDTDVLSLKRLELLHRHTAAKYKLKDTRTESVELALGSVIKEIHDVPYLNYDTRNDYCYALEKVYYEIKNREKSFSLTDIYKEAEKDIEKNFQKDITAVMDKILKDKIAAEIAKNKNNKIDDPDKMTFNYTLGQLSKASDPEKISFKALIKPKASDISWRIGIISFFIMIISLVITKAVSAVNSTEVLIDWVMLPIPELAGLFAALITLLITIFISGKTKK